MSTELIEKPSGSNQVVDLGVADRVIAECKKEFSGLDARENYEAVRAAISTMRGYRVGVEKSRKELKADVLERGKLIDSEAKRVTALIVEIEEPLKLSKQAVDDEKARIKLEKERAAEAERRAKIEAEMQAKREAEEAERKAREAELAAEQEKLRIEREKLAAERKAEEEKRAAEQAKIDAERKAEREKLEAERREVIEQQRKVREAQEKLEAEKRAEQERIEAEARAKREAEEAEQRRIAAEKEAEARKPDRQKLQEFSETLKAIEGPELDTEWAVEVRTKALLQVGDAIAEIEWALDPPM